MNWLLGQTTISKFKMILIKHCELNNDGNHFLYWLGIKSFDKMINCIACDFLLNCKFLFTLKIIFNYSNYLSTGIDRMPGDPSQAMDSLDCCGLVRSFLWLPWDSFALPLGFAASKGLELRLGDWMRGRGDGWKILKLLSNPPPHPPKNSHVNPN